MRFQGNRRVTITAIGGAIVMSRTSGQTPAFVQVSASGITCTGSSRPYEDLEFRWDFGDPTGTEVFTVPTTGKVENANWQYGADAAYCYRAAGTYTVTLTVRGKTASGYITETFTDTFTVTAFSGTDYWFDSVAGSDANDGLSIGAPKQSIAALNTLIGSNRRFNIKRGTHWTGDTGFQITAATYSGMRFQPYGGGADWIMEITSGTASVFNMSNGTAGSARPKSDIVISGADFQHGVGSRVFSANTTSNGTATITDLYLDNCNMEVTADAGSPVCQIQYDQPAPITRVGLWNCRMKSTPTANTGNRFCFFGGAMDWNFIVGGSMEGGGSSQVLDHHIYPQTRTHPHYKWIDFGAGQGKNYCINNNLTGDGSGSVFYGEYLTIIGCKMTGTLRAIDMSQTALDPTIAIWRHVVVEDNTMSDLDGDGIILFYCCTWMTIRRNRIWDCDVGKIYSPQNASGALYEGYFYDNFIYKTAGTGGVIDFAAGFTLPQEIYSNTIVDTRATTARAMRFTWSEFTTAGSYVDLNQIYATDTNPFMDSATEKTRAEWLAGGWDVNGMATDPGWIDPANGVFDLATGRFRFGITTE